MREYEQTPRPEIEQHYHIKSLIESQEKRTEDRTYSRDKAKEREERNTLIKEAQVITLTDFLCRQCNEEFKGIAVKQVEENWNNPNENNAFYKTKCFKGHWCIRYITDKDKDPYWYKSRAVARDRVLHHNDTLQPHQTGFNILYKKI